MFGAAIDGALLGVIYGLFALGVVLVYRGSGAINFAQGEIGTAALYAAWWLNTDQGLPWIVGAVAAVAAGVLIGVAFERLVVRPMVTSGRVAVTIATAGLLAFLVATEFQLFSDSPRALSGPVTGGGFRISTAFITPTQIIGLVVAVALGFGLAVFLRRTDFGLGVLAASQDPVTVRLVGVRVSRVSMFVWGLGGGLGAVACLFVAPTITAFTPTFGSTNLFLGGLAAAVVGGLASLPGAFVGGLIVGVLEQTSVYLLRNTAIPGTRIMVVFVLVLAVLLLRPQGMLARGKARAA